MQFICCTGVSVVPSPRKARVARGFTLVELLVVIGIIALLMSILLPTLGRVREQAAATQCMSNLRSFGQVLYIYASQNNGRAPIGYDNNKHAGYMVYHGSGWAVMGILAQDRLFDGGIKGFYCPSKEDVRWQFNTPENPWPAPGPGGALTRTGMTVRPAVKFGKGPGTTNGDRLVPVSAANDDPILRGKFPQLNNFRGKAIAAEMFGEPANSAVGVNPTITSHKKLINVYYEDNSVVAVPTSAAAPSQNLTIAEMLEKIRAAGSGWASIENEVYLGELDPAKKTGIWNVFDVAK